ncbi:MAG: inositol monophosphatase family protein [Oleiphilaceae bacterium]|nr:inositol monophosphatase family protein [Oleiphilaceae bacterium]
MQKLIKDAAELASQAALEAGAMIAEQRQQGLVQKSYKGQQELVTNADKAADQMIIARIKARFPDHRILSEETYTDRSQAADLEQPIWIIDPIDGTVNYAHGQNMVAVSIAFAMKGEVQAGVVYNPFLNECYRAVLGQGSSLNDQPLRPSGLTDASKALVATGFPYEKSTVPMLLKRVEKILMHCQDIRRLGSAAMDICWVASGRLDAYFESLSPWDFAAARLIALEAGARCGHFNPVPEGFPPCLYGNDILISTPAIYDTLDALLE